MGLGAVVKAYEVVMATYNGARYLDEQITSILGQTVPPARVLVADDGSTDRTLECLADWQLRSHVPIELLPPLGSDRLGCCRNFERLLQACTASYVMLADQDDIWDRDKAERLLEQMGRLEQCRGSEGPLLVHADLRLIDADGRALAASFHRRQGLRPDRQGLLQIGLQNVVTGCAALVNRACLIQALPFPVEVVLHDWWLALVAAQAEGISYLPKPCVSYRQHCSNVVGALGWRAQLQSRIRQFFAANRQVFAAELISPGLLQLRACVRRLGSAALVAQLEPLWSRSPWLRLSTALGLRLRKHGLWRTAGFYAALLICRPSGG
jgi:glycosyltransferase involved in cell wall biosynthesis